jgi:hypothetical protein
MTRPTLGLLVRPLAPDLGDPGSRRRFTAALDRYGAVAEMLGFAEIWVEEPAPRSEPSVGPFALLGHLAGRTSMAIGAVLPATSERVPSVTAKWIASLDVVTGGRAMVALVASRIDDGGVARFTSRDLEALLILETLLSETAPSIRGEYYVVTEAWNEPRVAERPTPLYLVAERPGAEPDDAPIREFVPYVGGRDVVLDEGGAVRSHELTPHRVVGVDVDATAATVARSISAHGELEGAIVFEWRGPLDPARLEAVLGDIATT